MRRPHPSEPDVFDDRRQLADAIYQDQAQAIEAGLKLNPYASALYWLGYRKWMSGVSFTPPDDPRRRQRLLRDLGGRPYTPELQRHLNALGWTRPPDRDAEERLARLKAYLDIEEGGAIRWGYEDTPGRDLLFKVHGEYLELVVYDGPAHIAVVHSQAWDNETSIAALGLTDDDYRFEVSVMRDRWWGGKLRGMRYTGQWFDYAERDGVWVELEFQGREWDGEWEGSQREHVAANLPKSEDPEASEATQEQEKREQERQRYADRKANANMRIVAMAQRNWKGDMLHPSRWYGENWFRTLWALGYRPAVWHGAMVKQEPTEPFTAEDARREEKVWDGWRPFREELERLEKLEE